MLVHELTLPIIHVSGGLATTLMNEIDDEAMHNLAQKDIDDISAKS